MMSKGLPVAWKQVFPRRSIFLHIYDGNTIVRLIHVRIQNVLYNLDNEYLVFHWTAYGRNVRDQVRSSIEHGIIGLCDC